MSAYSRLPRQYRTAFQAGVNEARRDRWMDDARADRAAGHLEAARVCVRAARTANRHLVWRLRLLAEARP